MRLIALIFGCSVALAQPHLQTISGVFQVVVVEDPGKGAPTSTESLQYSLVTGPETLRLILEDPQDAAKITAGSRVEVTGYRTGKQLTVPADPTANARIAPQSPLKPEPHIRTMSAAPAPKTVGQRKVAVVLCNFQNDQRQLVDSAFASALVFGDVNSFCRESSYGNVSVVGDVYGYLTLPIDWVCSLVSDASGATSGFADIVNAATQAAQEARIEFDGL